MYYLIFAIGAALPAAGFHALKMILEDLLGTESRARAGAAAARNVMALFVIMSPLPVYFAVSVSGTDYAIAGLALASVYSIFEAITHQPRALAAADVVDDAESLKALAKPFDPADYIDLKKGIFMGLSGKRKPIYLQKNIIDKNHKEILGESGVGKSSIAGVLLSQLAAAGECVIVFDPKNDRNLPGALAKAGKEWGGYPVHIIDMRPVVDYPQVNPFKNCRPDQVEELLQVALELGKTGDGGVDFYRGKDREATSFIAQAMEDGKTHMLEIIEKARNDERVTEQENLWRELRDIGRVKAFHTEEGLDLEAVLSKPGVLYIVGSTTKLEVVAAQKLILQRILQIVDERKSQEMPVSIFLDELKYILSPAALRAAGTIRDRNCHLLFAHQSLGDLDDCPGLNPKAVRGAIWGNSGIKVVYKMLDSQTATELSKIAGKKKATDETTSTKDGETSVSQSVKEVEYMPAHVFTHLPKPSDGEASVGVVFGLGPAWFLSTRWLQSEPAPEPLPAPPPGGAAGAQGQGEARPELEENPEPGQGEAQPDPGGLDDLMK